MEEVGFAGCSEGQKREWGFSVALRSLRDVDVCGRPTPWPCLGARPWEQPLRWPALSLSHPPEFHRMQ